MWFSHSSGNVVVNLLPIKFFFTHKFYKIISLLKLRTNWIKYFKKVMYIITLNFSNQILIIGFHLGFLETPLHWNKDTSIDNCIADVIIWSASTSINLKFHSFIEINYLEIIHCCWFFFSINSYVVLKLPLSNILSIVYILLRRDIVYQYFHL